MWIEKQILMFMSHGILNNLEGRTLHCHISFNIPVDVMTELSSAPIVFYDNCEATG